MFDIDLSKISEQIADKIKPVLTEGKKQAELSLIVNCATQIYCAETIRGGSPSIQNCVEKVKSFIGYAKTTEAK